MRVLCFALLASFCCGAFANATDFYIDPVHGTPEGQGTKGSPWQSLQGVFDRGLVQSQQWESLPPTDATKLVAKNPQGVVNPGDTIHLLPGDHGTLTLRGYYNEQPITLCAEPANQAVLHRISLVAASNWVFKDLTLTPNPKETKRRGDLISVRNHGHHGKVHDITVEGCQLSSASDSDIAKWTIEDWNKLPANGILADGTQITIRNNQVRNVNFGISVNASHSLVEHNLVENFAGDGLRGLGDYSVFQYNTVKNCYDVNDNHDDGFQSWSTGSGRPGSGKVVGITLRGNVIINFEDPNQPFRGPLQGIGCFDGMFEDWVVENNVIVVDQWHGLTLLGATGCRIVNNTVVDAAEGRPGPAWICIDKHKNGTPATNNVVRNNLVTSLRVPDRQANQVDHNLVIESLEQEFTDPSAFDFSLKADSKAIDAGAADLAPEIDIAGTPRPQGKAVDLGAYELKE
ncbi:right-handed parallel beta-helix repeat-containing protein [Aeoliella mucimassa]|uniref:Right handed beta helix domain-containing protein n=1 Tax=Aeoliella mucimassa TaxID=2527972 RepID=A0A518ATV8_9BACT|nr:right-handed parallel beta-helix repeat-containing protein [Aeoliella mucimassa]QDU58135.1 hypothetical protein Pan181_43620 [Aeoliella mucimassa]